MVAESHCDVLIRVCGTVQGVGFRPFVHRLAKRLHLAGWVRNDAQGVLIRAVGTRPELDRFQRALLEERPPAAQILNIAEEASAGIAPEVGEEFAIIASEAGGVVESSIPADLALCGECRRELSEAGNRRENYPFINCTQCGPRYSIIEALPYDRPATTMRCFKMCAECESEYHDPASRRFHAQPNACGCCGPTVSLRNGAGRKLASEEGAIERAAQALRGGMIVAVKGVGGYHLMADATDSSAVAELRRRKRRDEKPFAVMFANLPALQAVAHVTDEASELLRSAAAPVVLVPRRVQGGLAPEVAPGNPWLGALLAYSPLHVLLLGQAGRPVVATSANLSEEPLCTDDDEAYQRLAGIADFFLAHDRPIAHPVDDSVMRVARSGPVIVRRARGFAPTPLTLPAELSESCLCVGAQMKNTVAVAQGRRVVLSPHIGDLGNAKTGDVFRGTANMMGALHRRPFSLVVCDKHPGYDSTLFAERLGLPRLAVQHHLAHVLACLLEHRFPADDVLGLSWDGTGYGEDGTIWGGEFIVLRRNSASRFGRLRPFRLPGGDAAVREPRRVALSLLHGADSRHGESTAETLGFTREERGILRSMLERGINSPDSSSMGRLFDGVGALMGVSLKNNYEGQTPLAVEAAALTAGAVRSSALPVIIHRLPLGAGSCYELDWRPMIATLVDHWHRGEAVASLALGFHQALATAAVEMARRSDVGTVALSGGCFQNTLLLDLTVRALRAARFNVLVHRELPPNDGNIAAGQALGALWNLSSVALP